MSLLRDLTLELPNVSRKPKCWYCGQKGSYDEHPLTQAMAILAYENKEKELLNLIKGWILYKGGDLQWVTCQYCHVETLPMCFVTNLVPTNQDDYEFYMSVQRLIWTVTPDEMYTVDVIPANDQHIRYAAVSFKTVASRDKVIRLYQGCETACFKSSLWDLLETQAIDQPH